MTRRARVPLVGHGDLTEEDLRIFERVAAQRGRVSNVFKALANSPAALERVAAVGEYVRFHTSFDDPLREAVIMTVAHAHGCDYEWTQHWHIAGRLGVDEALLRRVGTPELEAADPPLGPVVRLARLVARDEDVPDDLVAQVQGLLGDAAFVDLVVAVAYYSMLARVLRALRVPLEDGVEAVEMPPGEGRSWR